jgi:acetyl-CoA carboxylase carboxyl transferase subunit alpha
VMIVGHQKGRDLKQRQLRNFGCPQPEGYRKAIRAMRLADKFGRPIICFVDTPGAYPGLGAEERGQAEAIAFNLREMARLEVPVIVCIVGEGGSGGALAIAVGNRVLMQENAIYTVITPEGCSAILWKDQDHVDAAASALKITAQDLKSLGVIDEIVPEPLGGAHTDHDAAADLLDRQLRRCFEAILEKPGAEIRRQRYDRFRQLGAIENLAQA